MVAVMDWHSFYAFTFGVISITTLYVAHWLFGKWFVTQYQLLSQFEHVSYTIIIILDPVHERYLDFVLLASSKTISFFRNYFRRTTIVTLACLAMIIIVGEYKLAPPQWNRIRGPYMTTFIGRQELHKTHMSGRCLRVF